MEAFLAMNQKRKTEFISKKSGNVSYYYQLPTVIVKIWEKKLLKYLGCDTDIKTVGFATMTEQNRSQTSIWLTEKQN